VEDNQLAISAWVAPAPGGAERCATPGCGGIEGTGGCGGNSAFNGGGSKASSTEQAESEKARAIHGAIAAQRRFPHMRQP
jgi:hypothetical protein